jgi:hypothetical protein
MNITSAKYISVQRLGDDGTTETVIDCICCTMDGDMNVSVPLDPANRHYAEILRQVAAGTLTIQDAD